MGLVHHTGSEAETKAFVISLVAALHLNGPEAMRETKKLLREVGSMGVGIASAKLSVDAIAGSRVSAEGQEGLKSFFAKKDASWKIKL